MRNRGSILVAVLWIAGILGVFAAVATMSLHAGADASRSFAELMRGDEAMRGAIEDVLGAGGQDSLPHDGSTVVSLGATTVALAFHDEIGRIDLNNAPIELLTGIFLVAGADAEDARKYSARVVDWRDPDDKVTEGGGAEVGQYRAAGRLDGPRNGPFQHVDELALVLGISPRIAAAVAPYVTVASGSDQINPLVADPPVLLALPGTNEDRVRDFLDARKSQVMTLDQAALRLGDVKDYITDSSSKAVRVDGLVRFGGRFARRFEVVVTTIQGDTEPYRILAWNDNPPSRVRQLQ